MAKKITEDGAANNPVTYGIGFTSSSPFERQLEIMAQVSGVFYYDYANGKFDFTGYKPFLEAGRELVAVAYPDQQGVDNMRAQFAAGAFALWGNASQEAGYDLPITSYIDERIDRSKMGRLGDFSLLDYESVYPAVPSINLTGDNYRTVLWNAIMGYVDIDEAINDLNTRYNQCYDDDIMYGSVQRLVIKDYDPLHPSAGTPEYLNQ